MPQISNTLEIVISIVVILVLLYIIMKYCNLEFYDDVYNIHPSLTNNRRYLIPLFDGTLEDKTPKHLPGISYNNYPRDGGYDITEDRRQAGMDLEYPKGERSIYELTSNVMRPIIQYEANNRNLPPVSFTGIRNNVDYGTSNPISGVFNNNSTENGLYKNTVIRSF